MPAAARRKQRAQRLKLLGQFVREHSWGVMITVLIVIALVLFVCVIAGASPKQADEPQTAQDAAPRYESGFICAITTQVPYYDEDLSQTGTVARGMQITYSTDKSVERDGVRYYLTYFTTLDCGYVSEENLTQDPNAVIAEKVVYVRTPQNLRLAKDSVELGALVEKGTQLQAMRARRTASSTCTRSRIRARRGISAASTSPRRRRKPTRSMTASASMPSTPGAATGSAAATRRVWTISRGKRPILPTTRCRTPATPSI